MPSPAKPRLRGWYLGIDPGANGGAAAICEDTCSYAVTTGRADLAGFLRSFTLDPRHFGKFAVVELNYSSPQMGVTSAFTFGRNCEMPSAMLSALGIPYEEIRPQVWIRYLNIPSRKKDRSGKGGETTAEWKNRLRAKAHQLFPRLDLWQETKRIQYAVCDALLIAEYCRRVHAT